MDNKRCYMCGVEKPVSEFHRNSKNNDGLLSYCKLCKKGVDAAIYRSRDEAWRERKRKRQKTIADRNSKFILEYLQQQKCVDCGESDPLVLEFDHVSGVKKYNIADLIRRYAGWATIMSEIEKCDVRCANCHRRATAKRQGMHRYLLLQMLEHE